MRHSTIFKSRWMALIWSAGIIWFAVDVAGGNDTAAPNATAAANASNDAASDDALDETRKLVDQFNR